MMQRCAIVLGVVLALGSAANSNSNSQAKANYGDRNRRLHFKNSGNRINKGGNPGGNTGNQGPPPPRNRKKSRGSYSEMITDDPENPNTKEDKGNFNTEKIKDSQDKNEGNAQYAPIGGADMFDDTTSSKGADMFDDTTRSKGADMVVDTTSNKGEKLVPGDELLEIAGYGKKVETHNHIDEVINAKYYPFEREMTQSEKQERNEYYGKIISTLSFNQKPQSKPQSKHDHIDEALNAKYYPFERQMTPFEKQKQNAKYGEIISNILNDPIEEALNAKYYPFERKMTQSEKQERNEYYGKVISKLSFNQNQQSKQSATRQRNKERRNTKDEPNCIGCTGF